MKVDTQKVFEQVEKYDSIIICGHMVPDGDCYGSVMGLALCLKQHYPNKEIYPILSNVSFVPNFLPQGILPETLSDEVFKNSLCFILDLANTPRLDEPRAVNCPYIIKIDHHELCQNFGNQEYVSTDRGSCCEIVADMCLDKFGDDLSNDCVTCFMLGLITDTGRFQYEYKKESFLTAYNLVRLGAKVEDIYTKLYTKTLDSFKLTGFIYNNFKCENGVSYIVFTKEDCHNLGVDFNKAASQVNQIGNIENFPIWISFAESDDGKVRTEFRCTKEYNVQPLAVSFGGGGHKQASGCQLNDIKDYVKVIKSAQNLEKWKL